MKFTMRRMLRASLLINVILMTQSVLAQQSVTLEQFREFAVQRNNNLKAAEQNVNVALAQKAQADTNGKFTIDGVITGFNFGKPINTLLPEYGISPGINFNQPIYAGGRHRLGKLVADETVDIQTARKALTTADVLYNTEVAYWQVVSAKERIKMAEQSQKQLAALYNDLNNQYAAGVTYKNDVLRANVQRNENELSLTQANDALTLAKLNLAQLSGLADSIDFDVQDSIAGSFEPLLTTDNASHALNNRSEIRILEKTLESARLQERIYKADLKPSVSLGISGVSAFGSEGINPENSSSNSMASYYGLLSVNIPLFAWGRRVEKIREQRYQISAQEYQLKENKEIISLQVRQSYLQLNQSAKRVALAELSLIQAEENLRLSQDRLKAGTIVGKDVLDAQTIWQQAYSNVIESKVEYKIREVDLKRMLGELK